jgi:hypothetical protein
LVKAQASSDSARPAGTPGEMEMLATLDEQSVLIQSEEEPD